VSLPPRQALVQGSIELTARALSYKESYVGATSSQQEFCFPVPVLGVGGGTKEQPLGFHGSALVRCYLL
jgi:hypothetical protein